MARLRRLRRACTRGVQGALVGILLLLSIPAETLAVRHADDCGAWSPSAEMNSHGLKINPISANRDGRCQGVYRLENDTAWQALAGAIKIGGYSLEARLRKQENLDPAFVSFLLDFLQAPDNPAFGRDHTLIVQSYAADLQLIARGTGVGTVELTYALTLTALEWDAALFVLNEMVKQALKAMGLGAGGCLALDAPRLLALLLEGGPAALQVFGDALQLAANGQMETALDKLVEAINVFFDQAKDLLFATVRGCLKVEKLAEGIIQQLILYFTGLKAPAIVAGIALDLLMYLGPATVPFLRGLKAPETVAFRYQPLATNAGASPTPTPTQRTPTTMPLPLTTTAASVTPTSNRPVGYAITDLGTLGGTFSAALGINNVGLVVGSSTTIASGSGAPFVSPFVWQNGKMTDLGKLGTAYGINDAGQIVGQASNSRFPGGDNEPYAFLYQEGQLDRIGTFGPGDITKMSINSSGQVVGSVKSQRGPLTIYGGISWANGTATSLQDVGEVGGINDQGQIVGTAVNQGRPQAAVLFDQRTGRLVELGYVNPQFNSIATAINATGVVAGSGGRTNRSWQAFVWKDGHLAPLPDLGDFRSSMAYGINASEAVVGSVSTVSPPDPSPVRQRAVMWRNGQVIDLNTLLPPNAGWVLVEARAINDRGQIVGSGIINGQTHAFVLTPSGTALPAATVIPTPQPKVGQIAVGTTVKVFGAGDCLNIRATPSKTARIVKCLPDGTRAIVVDGPRAAEGATWFLLDAGGWAVTDYLLLINVPQAIPGWAPAAPLALARTGHTATLLKDGQVLVVGGYIGEVQTPSRLASVERYDPVANRWTPAASLQTPRYGHTATLLNDGRVLVTGGGQTAAAAASAEIYDPVADQWRTAPAMSVADSFHSATLLEDGRVLVVHVLPKPNTNQYVRSAELFNPAITLWRPAATPPGIFPFHEALRLPDGRVLVMGGSDGPCPCAAFTVAAYNAQADAWTELTRLGTARVAHTTTLLPNGLVVGIGGSTDEYKVIATAERFDPGANKWTAVAPMSAPRSGHTATLLPNGQILVVGGSNFVIGQGNTTPPLVEQYNPANNGWLILGTMLTPRRGHSATLLRDGSLLIVGGNGEDGPLRSTERYVPGR